MSIAVEKTDFETGKSVTAFIILCTHVKELVQKTP
jgi:hypothetical protein